MRRTPGYAVLLLAGAALLLGAARARAVYPPPVRDDGKFFGAETLEKANKKIRELYQNYSRDVVVETFAEVPADREKKFKELDRKDFFAEWGRDRAHDLGVHGVYILVCRKPSYLQVEVDAEAHRKAFTVKDRERLRERLLENFKERKFDAGLLGGLELIETALKANQK